MSSTYKRTVVISLVSLMALFTVSCSESKTSQCNKLINVANRATTEIQSTSKSNNPDKTAQLDKIATSLDQYIQEMQALELKDEKLQGFQTRFVQLYKQTSQGSRGVATAVRKKDMKGANSSLQQMQTGIGQEQTLVNEVNQYCRGS